MRWPPTSGCESCWPTSSASIPGRSSSSSSNRSSTQDASLLGADRTIRPFDDTPAGNLPSIAGDLVGRETEIDAVIELLTAERLVEIVGPGGVGKTALAIAIGRQLSSPMTSPGGIRASGGVWLARLETAVTAHDVIDTLVAALNVGGEAALFERLRASTALVILDNCEHVLDAAADLAVRLLDAAPALRILCTSQVPLDVDGEALYELAPLALPEAVELFTRRASAQRSSRTTSDADDATRDLCRSLDGLPLAIELAAARTKTLSIEEITRRLDDRFTVLSDPTSRRPARRRELSRRSDGATSCCSPTTSEASGRSPPSPAVHRLPPSSPSSTRSTCQPRRRSTSSAASPAVRSSPSTATARRARSAIACSTASARSRSRR